MVDRLTTEYVRNIIESFGCELIGEYGEKNTDKITIKCSCGNIRKASYVSFINSNHLCEKCSRRTPKDEIINRFSELGLFIVNEIDIKGAHDKIDVVDKYGYQYSSDLTNAEAHFPKSFHMFNPYFFDNMKLWTILEKRPFDIIDYFINENRDIRVISKCNICNQKWNADWQSLYSGMSGCPWCVNLRVTKEKSFGYLFPDLLKDWDWDKNVVDPYKIPPNSHERIFWKCLTCKYCWDCIASNRSSLNRGCPGCAKKVPTSYNNLETRFPEILDEWVYEENGDPKEYSPFSGKKVLWRCLECDNVWSSAINNRTRGGNGCPNCSSPKAEKAIRKFLKKNNIEFVGQYSFDDCRNVYPLHYDFAIFNNGELDFLLEAQGGQHYFSYKHFGGDDGLLIRQKRDKIKVDYCYNNNIPLLLIKYTDFDHIPEILTEYLNL